MISCIMMTTYIVHYIIWYIKVLQKVSFCSLELQTVNQFKAMMFLSVYSEACTAGFNSTRYRIFGHDNSRGVWGVVFNTSHMIKPLVWSIIQITQVRVIYDFTFKVTKENFGGATFKLPPFGALFVPILPINFKSWVVGKVILWWVFKTPSPY